MRSGPKDDMRRNRRAFYPSWVYDYSIWACSIQHLFEERSSGLFPMPYLRRSLARRRIASYYLFKSVQKANLAFRQLFTCLSKAEPTSPIDFNE